MKNRISLCNVILAATLLFMGCTLLEKKDTVSPSAPNPIPTSKAQKTEKPTATYLITNKNGCNVRSKPNGKSKVMAKLKKGQIVQQIDQLENWYNIILPSGEKGWIHKDLVENTFPVSKDPLQTASSESLKTTVQPQENVIPPQTQKAAPQIKTDKEREGGVSSGKERGISSKKSEESSPSEGRIMVPGGLKNGKLNNLWKAAKNKCFELGYVVSNEDRDTGNIFCTKQFEGTPRTMQINFNAKSFLVVTQSPFGGGFLARFDRSTPLHKSEMESALKKVAGVKD